LAKKKFSSAGSGIPMQSGGSGVRIPQLPHQSLSFSGAFLFLGICCHGIGTAKIYILELPRTSREFSSAGSGIPMQSGESGVRIPQLPHQSLSFSGAFFRLLLFRGIGTANIHIFESPRTSREFSSAGSDIPMQSGGSGVRIPQLPHQCLSFSGAFLFLGISSFAF
jgi:hypothetical protein